MSEKFYNPYQFIPVKACKKENQIPFSQIEDLKQAGSFARHDFWRKDGLSGKLICSLKIESPTFVGNQAATEQRAGHPKLIEGYQALFNGKKFYSIPGNSLRGMVGNVAEILSQSALRVLEDKPLSVRKGMRESLSALGRLIKAKPVSGRSIYAMQPLTLSVKWEKSSDSYQMPKEWHSYFKGRTLQQVLPAYLNGYRAFDRTVNGKKVSEWGYECGSFLGRQRPCAYPVKPEGGSVFFYARLDPELAEIDATESFIMRSNLHFSGGFLIGQKILLSAEEKPDILSKVEFDELTSPEDKQVYTKGIIRALDVLTHEQQMPRGKKHEIFIPWPDENSPNLKPIPQFVEDRYLELIAESKKRDEAMPILLKGYKDADFDQHKLFYFDIDENKKISEVSLSSIWRKSVGTTYQYFDNDLLPWGVKRSMRDWLSPAEALWGVVQSEKAEQENSRNLASRLRFHDAVPMHVEIPSQQVEREVIALKILSSPKPPSPAMYFHDPKKGGLIEKTALKAGEHQPNGRKAYLHQYKQQDFSQTTWKTDKPTENADQKVQIKPLKVGQEFEFTIEFENLSKAELGLLRAALEPENDFIHKLGMGKPLGLGSVKVAIKGLCLLKRDKRYAVDSLAEPRYSEIWLAQDTVLLSAVDGAESKDIKHYSWENTLVDQTAKANLLAVGIPSRLQKHIPVHYPKAMDQTDETEGFVWFGNNADQKYGNPKNQALSPVKNSKVEALQKNRLNKNR
ncbi:TIGR03986 family type III CRISPR-associated RAMP protein [Thiofilum flexile]|uniref:TIGR03986 family type III CRISPR-associated RAMP protein n=1 Tax=Thiofilum flexile TaxID=125627 RepID=UPI0003643381|nr:TIGR03986 family CRISPR-associated RAMP protein [Thiofilum flexile]